MNRAASQLVLVLCASLIACGGKGPVASQPAPVPSEAEDLCSTGGRFERRSEPYAEFCKTRGADPNLEKRMTEIIVGAGADVRRFSTRCRADICSVKCVTVPREQCVEELDSVVRWSARQQVLDGVWIQDKLGQVLFKFLSKEYVAAQPARRALLDRIVRRLHDSPAFLSCKENASAHGLLLLYIEVPTSGTPSVTLDRSDLAQTADADCISKALLGAVIDERVAPPLSTRDLPIAVKL